jgi:hypothetical protein
MKIQIIPIHYKKNNNLYDNIKSIVFYIETEYIESMSHDIEDKRWELKMVSGDSYYIDVEQFIRFNLL